MTRGLIIPAVPSLPLVEQEFDGLTDFQEAVNGFIEPVAFADPCLTLYINEEGKRRRMSLNERATVLWWLLTPGARGSDLIVGDAVLIVEGASASSVVKQLQCDPPFHVEAQLALAGDEWLEGPRGFGSWLEAAKFALALENRFDFIVNVRVTT